MADRTQRWRRQVGDTCLSDGETCRGVGGSKLLRAVRRRRGSSRLRFPAVIGSSLFQVGSPTSAHHPSSRRTGSSTARPRHGGPSSAVKFVALGSREGGSAAPPPSSTWGTWTGLKVCLTHRSARRWPKSTSPATHNVTALISPTQDSEEPCDLPACIATLRNTCRRSPNQSRGPRSHAPQLAEPDRWLLDLRTPSSPDPLYPFDDRSWSWIALRWHWCSLTISSEYSLLQAWMLSYAGGPPALPYSSSN